MLADMIGISHGNGMVVELWTLFFVGSVLGWGIEVMYRSYHAGRLVNPGMLHGPYVPLYGIGLLCIVLAVPLAERLQAFTAAVLVAALVTAVEYVTGAAVEKFLGLRLWDYRGRRFNLHGRICLRFSLYWFLLIFLVLQVLQLLDNPLSSLRAALTAEHIRSAVAVSAIIIASDAAVSLFSILRLRSSLQKLRVHTAAEDAAIAVQRRLQHIIGWARRFPAIARQLVQQRQGLRSTSIFIPEHYRPSRRYTRRKQELLQWVRQRYAQSLSEQDWRLVDSTIAAAAALPVRARRVVEAQIHPGHPDSGIHSLRPTERLLVFLVRTRVESMP